ncbi:hypothetical protein BS50DRAFT_224542 [Corynespora cassiicola Philippines]|uniref:MADS-box domain-containing protein n=1 Tax=Corynespora cassiicola Philippines TaxID=1448308 RepID=A0A2T2N2B0_CORCC|nr:hypothetical protein BS50DRAFT_224542 [Corynespora cassiicola Philippines]
MAVRKATNKVHNKKLRRRREGLLTKAYEYGELDGVELALFIRYPKRGEFYYYTSREGLPWLRDVEEKMAHPKAKRECTENVKKRVEETRRKQKKLRSVSLWRDEASDCHEDSPWAVHADAFPEFLFDIATLKALLKMRPRVDE